MMVEPSRDRADPARERDSFAMLDAACAAALQLADGPRGTPARVRLSVGEVSLELEWTAVTAPAAPAPVADDETLGAESVRQPGTHLITAPIVGTFYRAQQPGAKPFVEVGDTVEKGQTVGIVEAMKLMNSIAADATGTVTEILVADATPIEYGQPLLMLTLADQSTT